MTSSRKIVTGSLLAFFGAAAACATAAPPESGVQDDPGYVIEPPPDDAGAPVEADAEADSAVVEAGACSTSGLCSVSAPLEEGRVTVVSIAGSGPSDVWAVGSLRAVLHFDGSAWERTEIVDEVQPTTMRSVWVGSASDVWIVDDRTLRHSTGWNGAGGTEWTTATPGYVPTALAGRSGSVLIGNLTVNNVNNIPLRRCEGWADAGPAGCVDLPSRFLAYVPGLASTQWTGVGTMASTRVDEAWAALVNGSRVARVHVAPAGSGDAGERWMVSDYDSRSTRDILGIWGNDDVVWLVGEGGTLRRLARENIDTPVFDVVASPVGSTLRSVYGFSKDDVWAVGDDATVVHWDGEAWTKLDTPFDSAAVKPRLSSVWGSSPNDVWIGGHGVMLHLEGKTP